MIRIGDFARLAGVSVETLRHYDELGLLKPERVDEGTSYRYYSGAQLPRLNRILALKDFGFSLRQIAEVLDDLSIEQLAGMLMMTRAQVAESVAAERGRLARIEWRLKQIELEEKVSDYDVVLKEVPRTLVASCRVTVPSNDQVPKYLGEAFEAAYGLVRKNGAKDSGPCLAVWHQAAAILVNEEVEAAVPVDRTVPATDRVRVYELPATTVASVVHKGPFAGMKQGHAVLLSWLEANGYEASGGYREVYVQDSRNEAELVTEIQYPVKSVRGAD